VPPPAAVVHLVERFDSNREAYRSFQHNGAEFPQELPNPFFEAMGWDVYNRNSYPATYKGVIHEAAIKVGGRTKAPGYCFRARGELQGSFVEVKNPSVDIALRNPDLSQRNLNFAVQRTIDGASEESSLIPSTGVPPLAAHCSGAAKRRRAARPNLRHRLERFCEPDRVTSDPH